MWPKDDRACPWPFGHVWINLDEKDNDIPWQCQHCQVLADPIDSWQFTHARRDQRPPEWTAPWATLFFRGGRGSGKTRTGAELTNRVAGSGMTPRVMLVGATGPDIRSTMVEGESGILATARPDQKPIWEASKKQLTWPNGCIGQGLSAEEPDRIRGPQSGFTWADEPAHWDHVEEAWENILYSLRLGRRPKIVATSTPKPTDWVRDTLEKKTTVDRKVSTYSNLSNLSLTYRENTITPHEGTERGKQELFGEILAQVEGALWKWDYIHSIREHPDLLRIIVAVDPAGTANPRSDLTGIVVLGLGVDKRLYVLDEKSGKFSPEGWGRTCVMAYTEWEADCIVAEKNYGGDMVRSVIKNAIRDFAGDGLSAETIPVKLVTSRRGKVIRAEPIVQLYEKELAYHWDPSGNRARLVKLEDELTSWVPGKGPSPNRLDALVHGAHELAKTAGPAEVANPYDVLEAYRRSGGTIPGLPGRGASPMPNAGGAMILPPNRRTPV